MIDAEVTRVSTDVDRVAARAVFETVYVTEKGWSAPSEDPLAPEPDVSWLLARVRGEPAGLLRLRYDPPVEFPPGDGAVLRDDVDWAAVARRARLVDVGRFMITPTHRRRPKVALRLMGAAVTELVDRGYTHLVTDVFEGERHSPLDFHVRVLGFEVIGWHDHGELNERRRRLVLLLDIDRAYRALRQRRAPVVQMLIGDARDELEARLQRPDLQVVGGGDAATYAERDAG
jgi:hypothetical protein